jgi:hypothetical protein
LVRVTPRNRECSPNVGILGFDRASQEGHLSAQLREGQSAPRPRGLIGRDLARFGAWALILSVVQFFALHLRQFAEILTHFEVRHQLSAISFRLIDFG